LPTTPTTTVKTNENDAGRVALKFFFSEEGQQFRDFLIDGSR
jgi:hypothetical protein